MAADKSSPEIVTEPLPDPMLWLDLVFAMDKLNKAMTQFDALTEGRNRVTRRTNPPFRNDDLGGSDE